MNVFAFLVAMVILNVRVHRSHEGPCEDKFPLEIGPILYYLYTRH